MQIRTDEHKLEIVNSSVLQESRTVETLLFFLQSFPYNPEAVVYR